MRTIDLKPGGVFHYGMKGPKNMEMWGKFVFHDIVPPEVFNVMTLASDGTVVTLKGAPIRATAAERDRFRSLNASMTQGFAGAFDQLEAYLKTGAFLPPRA